jgi:hypothetical protein
VPGDGLVVEIRRVPAQLSGQFSTHTRLSRSPLGTTRRPRRTRQ